MRRPSSSSKAGIPSPADRGAERPLAPPGPGTGSRWQAFYAVIARIPRGRVATYGQIADLAGHGGCARQVGYALAAMPDGVDLPWHRVINARGEVSPRSRTGLHQLQRLRLEAEGVPFVNGRVDLARYRWRPRRRD